jgi:hypothetical protein
MDLQWEDVQSLPGALQTCELLVIFMLVFHCILPEIAIIEPQCASVYINTWAFPYNWM